MNKKDCPTENKKAKELENNKKPSAMALKVREILDKKNKGK